MLATPTKRGFFLLLLAWLIVNLVQATFTGLAHDEAYYWVWAQNLDWGYFEHPPMVALFIWLGGLLFDGELGVRLLTVLSSTTVLYLLFRLLKSKDVLLFAALVSGTLLLNIGGFYTAPDSALMLFGVLFLAVYKRYLAHDSWAGALLLALSMALVMYSKYFGALLIGFACIANLRTFAQRPSFWAAVLFGVLLYVPHLVWFAHQFDTFAAYNLEGERMRNPFELIMPLRFVGGQLLLAGPLIGFISFYAAFKTRTADPFLRALQWVVGGVLACVFLLSFAGNTEANWTAAAFAPLLLLAHYYITDRPMLRKWTIYLALPSMLLICLMRVQIAIPVVTGGPLWDRTQEFHGWESYAASVDSMAAGRPIVANSYQHASKLHWALRKPVTALNIHGRANQYEFYDWYDDLRGETVLYNYEGLLSRKAFKASYGRTGYAVEVGRFIGLGHVRVRPISKLPTLPVSGSAMVELEITNGESYAIPAFDEDDYGTSIAHSIYRGREPLVEYPGTPLPRSIPPGGADTLQFEIIAPDSAGHYAVAIWIGTPGGLQWWKKFVRYELEVGP